MLRRIPTLLALVLALEANASESCRIVLEGLDRELKENVMAHLGAAREGESAASLARRLQIAAADGLRALGYYEPDIRLAVNNGTSAEAEVDAKDKTACTITAHIKAGRRVTLLAPDIVISGEAADDPDFKALAASAKPAGTPLNHADYEEFKQRIEALAMQKGYFDGAFSLTALEVLVSKAQARWRLHYDSKARFRFGPVQFKGSQIEEKYLSGIIPFETGAYYDYPVYAELSNNLSQTGWFASVALEPDFEAARKDAELHLPVTARVTPRKQNIVETGLGFATDVGPHGRLKWTRPWANAKGHSLSAQADVSAKEQEVDVSYKIPQSADPLKSYWLLQSGYKYTDLNDTQSSQLAVSGSHFRLLESGWTRQISVNWLTDNFSQADVSTTSMVIYPGIAFSRTRSRGGVMPSWGDSQRYSVQIANKAWGSDVDFIILEASHTWVRSLGLQNQHRFVFRGGAGWIDADNFEAVPPDLRFFAGGDTSVRGYDYKSISPRNAKGELTGGSKLLTGSVEYQYNVSGNWWGAVFFDVGEAVNDFSTSNFKKGAGFGVRWKSPVGPVKIDLARAVGDGSENGWKVYIGFGGSL